MHLCLGTLRLYVCYYSHLHFDTHNFVRKISTANKDGQHIRTARINSEMCGCTVVHLAVMGLREIQIIFRNIINIAIRWFVAYRWMDVVALQDTRETYTIFDIVNIRQLAKSAKDMNHMCKCTVCRLFFFLLLL